MLQCGRWITRAVQGKRSPVQGSVPLYRPPCLFRVIFDPNITNVKGTVIAEPSPVRCCCLLFFFFFFLKILLAAACSVIIPQLKVYLAFILYNLFMIIPELADHSVKILFLLIDHAAEQ